MSETKSMVHTETLELPSKGWYYPKDHPLSSGKIELFSPTAYHEDILTSTNLIQRGTVVDKFLESLIATKDVKYGDLLLGDKNAIFVAARILAYGKRYDVTVECPKCETKNSVEIDLQELKDKEVEFRPESKGKNEFMFKLPLTGKTVIFRLLTQADEKKIDSEINQLSKITKSGISPEVTTRMRYSVISIDGETDIGKIKHLVENMQAREARAFREFGKQISPDVDLTFSFECNKCGHEQEGMEVPIDISFLWPDARV